MENETIKIIKQIQNILNDRYIYSDGERVERISELIETYSAFVEEV